MSATDELLFTDHVQCQFAIWVHDAGTEAFRQVFASCKGERVDILVDLVFSAQPFSEIECCASVRNSIRGMVDVCTDPHQYSTAGHNQLCHSLHWFSDEGRVVEME